MLVKPNQNSFYRSWLWLYHNFKKLSIRLGIARGLIRKHKVVLNYIFCIKNSSQMISEHQSFFCRPFYILYLRDLLIRCCHSQFKVMTLFLNVRYCILKQNLNLTDKVRLWAINSDTPFVTNFDFLCYRLKFSFDFRLFKGWSFCLFWFRVFRFRSLHFRDYPISFVNLRYFWLRFLVLCLFSLNLFGIFDLLKQGFLLLSKFFFQIWDIFDFFSHSDCQLLHFFEESLCFYLKVFDFRLIKDICINILVPNLSRRLNKLEDLFNRLFWGSLQIFKSLTFVYFIQIRLQNFFIYFRFNVFKYLLHK